MTAPARLTAGSRMRSQVCTTEVIVVRTGSRPVLLACGGHPMVDLKAPSSAESLKPEPGFEEGTALGKRYTHPLDDALEVLVTKAGDGSLSDGETLLTVKRSKPLPASD